MNKSDLVKKIAEKNNIPLSLAEECVDTFFETISLGLLEGNRVELRGFGVFYIKEYDGYLGRNPKTGESVAVSPKRMPVFKMGKSLLKEEATENEEVISNEQ